MKTIASLLVGASLISSAAFARDGVIVNCSEKKGTFNVSEFEYETQSMLPGMSKIFTSPTGAKYIISVLDNSESIFSNPIISCDPNPCGTGQNYQDIGKGCFPDQDLKGGKPVSSICEQEQGGIQIIPQIPAQDCKAQECKTKIPAPIPTQECKADQDCKTIPAPTQQIGKAGQEWDMQFPQTFGYSQSYGNKLNVVVYKLSSDGHHVSHKKAFHLDANDSEKFHIHSFHAGHSFKFKCKISHVDYL